MSTWKTSAELVANLGINRSTLNRWTTPLLKANNQAVRRSGNVILVDEDSLEFAAFKAGHRRGRPRGRGKTAETL